MEYIRIYVHAAKYARMTGNTIYFLRYNAQLAECSCIYMLARCNHCLFGEDSCMRSRLGSKPQFVYVLDEYCKR